MMQYYPNLSASKDGFALTIHSRGALGALVSGLFPTRLVGWVAGRRFVPWRVADFLFRPLGWSWVDGIRRFEMPISPVDALHVCWALDFTDREVEFFWAMQVSLMWEDAREQGDDDIAVALKGLLASQGFDEMGEPVDA